MGNRGGYYRDKQGYEMVKAIDHPYKDSRGYVRVNRFLLEGYLTALNEMAVFLHPSINVEHIDGNKENYNISNLKIVGRGYRTPKPKTETSYSDICSSCGGIRKAKFAGGLCEKCYDRKIIEESGTHLCACDCGELIPKIYKDGTPRLYKKCHNLKGEKNVRWNGGVRIDKDGYRYILKPDHPFCDHAGYVPEHRLVLENYYSIIFDEKIFIPFPEYEIHHIKPVTNDYCDNSLMNLELLTKKEHKEEHWLDMSDRFCCDPECNDKNRIYLDKRTGRPRWRNNIFDWLNGEWLHEKCFRRNFNKNEKK